MFKPPYFLVAVLYVLQQSLYAQADDRDALTPKTINVLTNSVGMDFVRIQAGKFVMGSAEHEHDRRPDERRIEVTLKHSYLLGRCEVTREQFVEVLGEHCKPWDAQPFVRAGSHYPATYVSHQLASAFCRILTEREHLAKVLPDSEVYRLPTEAEWEYACRAGSQAAYSFGEDSSKLDEYAWFGIDRTVLEQAFVRPVGKKKANGWGLSDMYGNVSEWCLDVYNDVLPGGEDPLVTTDGPFRVFRGGNWRCRPAQCRSASRDRYGPGFSSAAIGFRVARVCKELAHDQSK